MAHQAGPSSLKLAALSAYSYHLDSPPFTGTAGPLGESVDDYERLRENASNLVDEQENSDVSGNQTPAAVSRPGRGHRERVPTSSSARQQQNSQGMQEGLQEREKIYARHHSSDQRHHNNVDVPKWDLEDADRQKDPDRKSLAADGSSSHFLSNSLSPPPFSSSALGPLAGRPLEDNFDRSRSSENHNSQHRESSRPAFAQVSSTTLSNEDASSAATDADADVDADAEEGPYDGEVDGNEMPFVLRSSVGTINGFTSSKVPTQSQNKEEYRFPRHRLPTRMRNETKIPLVIVACGSFSPPTYLHLRIFEMAKDQVMESGKYELLGGYYSPVSDYYKKEGLAKATHRVRMCELAVEKTSTWLMVDAWESLQDEYQRTAVVLDHFDEELNSGSLGGGITLSNGGKRKIRIMLLAGGDLIQSMGEPGVWADVDLNHILGKYGCMIVERTGADVWSFLLSHDLLWRYRRNLKIVKQTIFNDISSSKVRLFVRRGQSIKYLLPNSVIHYIDRHKLYRLPKELDTEPPDADNQHMMPAYTTTT